MKVAFINPDHVVVQVISGDLDESMRAAFLRDYSVLFGATNAIEITDDEVRVWIGGTYNDVEGFLPPPPPPVPEIVEGTSEELAPLVEEIANGDAPIE